MDSIIRIDSTVNNASALTILTSPSNANAVIEIERDVDLTTVTDGTNCDIVLPPHAKLHFINGAFLKCVTLAGNHNDIIAPPVKVIETNAIYGRWKIDVAYPEWFGAVGYLESEFYTADYDPYNTKGFLYNLRFSASSFTDSKDAIQNTFDLRAREVCFRLGYYFISNTVFVKNSNLHVCKGATIFALRQSYTIGDFVVMVESSYENPSQRREIFRMEMMPMIYGGGCIDGNLEAKIGLEINNGYRTVIENMVFKNCKYCGLKTSQDNSTVGNCYARNCLFLNEYHYDEVVGGVNQTFAIVNNRSDSVFTNIETADYKVGVLNIGQGAFFTNLHAWLPFQCSIKMLNGFIDEIISLKVPTTCTSNDFWNDSVVIHSIATDLTLVTCTADTMRKMLVCAVNNLTAKIFDCRGFINPDVVDITSNNNYPPVIIDNCNVTTHITIIGTYFNYGNVTPVIFSTQHDNDTCIG